MEVKFARNESVATTIVHYLGAAVASIDAALYRLNHAGLAQALQGAAKRGVRVRLLVDGNKYQESRITQELLEEAGIPFRLSFGRRGQGSKMHHKFVILDQQTILTGSYNWTVESEDENYENLILAGEKSLAEAYQGEFEALWMRAVSPDQVQDSDYDQQRTQRRQDAHSR